MRRLARTALPLGLVFVFLTQGTAHAGFNVLIDIDPLPGSGVYVPNPASAVPGNSVGWTNNTTLPHSATGNSPLNFWDTGTFGQGVTRGFTFNVAGGYAYHCVVHPNMQGTVNVRMVVSPSSGTVNSTVFTIRWANASIPSGFNADIQFRRNGGAWTGILANRTGTQVMAQGMIGTPGTYDLRARVQRTSNGAASAYSPPVTLTVT